MDNSLLNLERSGAAAGKLASPALHLVECYQSNVTLVTTSLSDAVIHQVLS